MRHVSLFVLLLSISCSTTQHTDKDASKKLATFENQHIKFNYSKDWVVYINDTIKDRLSLAPIDSHIGLKPKNGELSFFTRLTIRSDPNTTFTLFNKKANSKKLHTKTIDGKTTINSYSRFIKLNDFHFIEKTRIFIER